jgi:hypothetical protein
LLETHLDALLNVLPVYVSSEALVLHPHHEARGLDAYASYSSFYAYFEGIDTLVKSKLIDPSLVDDTVRASLTRFWEKYRLIRKKMRRCMNHRHIWE